MPIPLITDYVNYTLAKSEVPVMYIVGGGTLYQICCLKNRFSPIILKIVGLQKKVTRITNAYKSILYNFYYNAFCCEINTKKKSAVPVSS